MPDAHTIRLLEQRARPKGAAYTRRLCDDGCGREATHLANERAFLCPVHANEFCLQQDLSLPVFARIPEQRPPVKG